MNEPLLLQRRIDLRRHDSRGRKPDYVNNNPCTGKWQLAPNAIAYQHSSAKYYLTGEQGVYAITNFMEMQDVDFK